MEKRDYNAIDFDVKKGDDTVAVITAQGITADWLHSAGFGPEKPVADNGKEEARAKNRRGELVKS